MWIPIGFRGANLHIFNTISETKNSQYIATCLAWILANWLAGFFINARTQKWFHDEIFETAQCLIHTLY